MKVYIYATYHCDTREVVGHGGELESVCIAEVEIGYILLLLSNHNRIIVVCVPGDGF